MIASTSVLEIASCKQFVDLSWPRADRLLVETPLEFISTVFLFVLGKVCDEPQARAELV